MKPEENTNFYNPDDDGASGDAAAPAAKNATVSWTASEYIEHQRGASWYMLLLVSTAVLAGGVYFAIKDYFATGIIILLGIIVAASAGRKPGQMTFELSSSGLTAGQKNYGYNLFKSFSVMREGTLTSLSLTPLKRFMPPVSAYFDPADEQKIVSVIGEHLPYEERKPGAIDRLSFRLRL